MAKKSYQPPEIEIVFFDEDVICTSGDPVLPEDPFSDEIIYEQELIEW